METAEFRREKRQSHYFMYRTTPFQNPATARTAGSCERTGATKAPVLSPALSFVPRKRAKGLRAIFHKGANSAPNPAHTRQEGQGLCPSPKEGTQPLTRPNRGCFPSLCPSAREPLKVGPGFRPDRRSSGGAKSDKVGQALCLSHPWVGKTAFPGRASTGGTSALRTARRCGMVFPALFSTVHFSLIGGANRSGLVAQTGRGWEPGQRASAGHTAPTRPCSAPPGLRSHPVSREAHRSAQGEVGDASVFPIAEEQSRFLCIAYQNLTGQGVSGKRFRLQNLPQIFVCSPGKIPLEFLKLPV